MSNPNSRGMIGTPVFVIGVDEESESTVKLPPDQDPDFDTANGARLAVTASVALLTPPAGCKWVRIDTDAAIYVNTAGAAAAANAASIRITTGAEIIPVKAGVAVYAMAVTGTANVGAMPLKARS
ncbi:hypothetical protein V5F77_02350 [Xanthobacter sp. DSM 24535]|uniref:hypothetical protein n=1 Tax=Roseixanthobacter psychrophilus TaxID=3119917 RepID=UPI00372CB6CC